jgi:cephalosporin hydroxylase
MKLRIDTEGPEAAIVDEATGRRVPLYSAEGFDLISAIWLKVGWNERYSYNFTWAGRPIIQLPEDIVRIQEAIWEVRPTLVIETGVAHGGSLVLYATVLKALGGGRVVGIDREIRPHNRRAIEAHELAAGITLVEGSSTDAAVVAQVTSLAGPSDRVMVILDSDHSYRHVSAELLAYAPMVSVGSYLVATDGVMAAMADTPRGQPGWTSDNPTRAAADFVARNPDFAIVPPPHPFRESSLTAIPSYWPGAWLRRLR